MDSLMQTEEAGSNLREPEDQPQAEVSPKEVCPTDESKEDVSVPPKKARRASRGEIHGLIWSSVLGPPDMSGVTSRSNSRSLRPVKTASLNFEETSGVPVQFSPGKEKVESESSEKKVKKSTEKKKRTVGSESKCPPTLVALLEEFHRSTIDKLSHPPVAKQRDLLFMKLNQE